MKIRKGFVSNSSSSSFVILNPEDYQLNTIAVAVEVLRNLAIEWETDWPEEQGRINNLKQIADKLESLNNLDENPQLIIESSCNYKTYIWAANKYPDENRDERYINTSKPVIRISTCNNNNWDSCIEKQNWINCGYGADMGDYPEGKSGIIVENAAEYIYALLEDANAKQPTNEMTRAQLIAKEVFGEWE